MQIETRRDPLETHEQFLQRAAKVFPVDSSMAWTPFERAVFNNLMGKLIFRYSYAEISDAMLQQTFEQMQRIVRRSSCAEPTGYPSSDRRRLAGEGKGR